MPAGIGARSHSSHRSHWVRIGNAFRPSTLVVEFNPRVWGARFGVIRTHLLQRWNEGWAPSPGFPSAQFEVISPLAVSEPSFLCGGVLQGRGELHGVPATLELASLERCGDRLYVHDGVHGPRRGAVHRHSPPFLRQSARPRIGGIVYPGGRSITPSTPAPLRRPLNALPALSPLAASLCPRICAESGPAGLVC